MWLDITEVLGLSDTYVFEKKKNKILCFLFCV